MKIFLIILLLTNFTFAQNLDSLYNELLVQHSKIKSISQIQIQNTEPNKCGFGLTASVKAHINEFSYEQQQTIEEILSRPTLQTSLVSSSGFFRIHYDTTGQNAPTYNISDLAIACDSAYTFEVTILGYPAPPKDGTSGGDDKYDIYVFNLGRGSYGQTTQDFSVGSGKFTSYIFMDNSFGKNEGYNTYDLNAAKATVAHEFHHAIQLGNYLFKDDDIFYHELTSTAMEEFVFTDVNDYYAYMPGFFKYTSNRLADHTGYDLAILPIFLHQRFGDEAPNIGDKILKKSWEIIRAKYEKNSNINKAVIALAEAMAEFGYSFSQEFNTFGDWLYFTNYRTQPGKYFEEAKNYPLVKTTISAPITNTESTFMVSCNPTSINYLLFTEQKNLRTDTLYAVLSNSDVFGSSSNISAIDCDFTIANFSFSGSTRINDLYFSKVSGEFISHTYIYNNQLTIDNNIYTEVRYPYPQPFVYQNNSQLYIPANGEDTKNVELNIYTSDMNQVYSSFKNIVGDQNIVSWNGLDNDDNKVASGVYVYVTKSGSKITKGKFVILN